MHLLYTSWPHIKGLDIGGFDNVTEKASTSSSPVTSNNISSATVDTSGMFQYLATAGQTEFTGADTNGNNLSFSNIALTNNDNLQDNYFQQNTEHNENLEFVKDRVNPMNSAEIFTGNLINNKYYGIGILKLFSNEICYGKCNFLIFY